MGTKLITMTAIPVIVPIAEDIVKQSYAAEGRPELFDAEDVRMLATGNDQLALAGAGLMRDEQTASLGDLRQAAALHQLGVAGRAWVSQGG